MKFILLLLLACTALAGDFALRDGDTCVFLGDSITAARDYSKVVENYTLLRFPERKIRFVNSGKGGETAHGALERLQSAVFDKGATVVVVAYGVNDIGWGMKADAEHKALYIEGVAQIISRCQERGIRVFICSPAITAEAPDAAEKGFLQTMCDEGLALAKSKGAGTIDVLRTMRSVQRRVIAANAKVPDKAKHTHLHVADGVHLNELGQFAMAFAILKGLDAPAEVSAMEIDAATHTTLKAEACRITDLRRDGTRLVFTRADDRLPMNLAPLWGLHGIFVPVSELNQYRLAVKNLPDGKYTITANDRTLGRWDAAALSRGVDLPSASPDPWQPGGLWEAQGHAVKALTDARDRADHARSVLDAYFDGHPQRRELRTAADALDQRITALQRAASKPQPVEFVIAPAE